MIEKRFGSEKKKKSLCHKCSLLDLHNKLVKILAETVFKLCRTRLSSTNYVRYLGINIGEGLNRKTPVHHHTSKLNIANATLVNLRHFVNCAILSSTFFAIFYVI